MWNQALLLKSYQSQSGNISETFEYADEQQYVLDFSVIGSHFLEYAKTSPGKNGGIEHF